MLKRMMLFFIGVVSAGSLRAQAGGGFAELGDVFSAYVAAMKTNDDAALMDFCLALTPDEATTQYMDVHHLCYRGIPCQMNQHGVNRQYLADEFFDGLVRLRDGLRAAGLLDGLAHPDTTAYRWEYELFVNLKAPGTDYLVDQMNFSLSMARYAALEAEARAEGVTLDALLLAGKNGEVLTVRGTEDEMHLTSGDFHIHYSMGELVCINARWLLFTKPRPDYEVRGKGGVGGCLVNTGFSNPGEDGVGLSCTFRPCSKGRDRLARKQNSPEIQFVFWGFFGRAILLL